MNLPLAQRAGRNQGPQDPLLARVLFQGQPAVRIHAGMSVGVEGKDQVGAGYTFTRGGYFLNLCGDTINVLTSTVLPDGSRLSAPVAVPVGLSSVPALFLPFTPGMSTQHEVVSGPIDEGQGLFLWSWPSTFTRNAIFEYIPITAAPTLIGPGPGRAWIFLDPFGLASVGVRYAYLNLDSIPRTLDESLVLAGEELLINAGSVIAPGGLEYLLSGMDNDTILLAHPDKLLVQTREAQATAPLYFISRWAEFDLPKDGA